MDRVRQALRSGDWLTRERIRLVAVALLFASVAGFLYLVATAHGGVDQQGRPIGTDFSNVYAAGTLVNDGKAATAFDPALEYAREREIFGNDTLFYGWHYPPFFLFVASLLALLPYGLALAVWQAATLGLYLLAIRAIVAPTFSAPGREGEIAWRHWLLLALAFPPVLINIGHGQNGFLTAALLGSALATLDRRPVLAGILLGLLVYKPQYGLLLPVVLGVSGRWKCFAAAATTVIVLTIATTFAFGMPVWHAFAIFSEFTRKVVLEEGDTGFFKIQSIFAWARMWGAPIPLAYAVQGLATLGIAAALAWLWRSAAPYPLKAAALCIGTILATPYSFDYDMMVLAPAIAFFAAYCLQRGFLPWEKTALAALWLVPLIARTVAHASMIPLGVPVMLTVFVLILRRAGFDLPMVFFGASSTMAASPGGISRGPVIAPDQRAEPSR